VTRLRELSTGRLNSAGIARRLNAEGFCPPKRTNRFTAEMVLRLTTHLGLARRQRHGSSAGLEPDEYRPMSLARRLGISRDTIRRWLRAGWLNLRRDEDGHHVIWADAGELRRLRELHHLPRTWANKTRLAKLKQPKPRPARVNSDWPGCRPTGPPHLQLWRHRDCAIERLFQRVTEVFDLRHLIGSTPQATVFQAAFCLLLSNVIQTVRGYVAESRTCHRRRSRRSCCSRTWWRS